MKLAVSAGGGAIGDDVILVLVYSRLLQRGRQISLIERRLAAGLVGEHFQSGTVRVRRRSGSIHARVDRIDRHLVAIGGIHDGAHAAGQPIAAAWQRWRKSFTHEYQRLPSVTDRADSGGERLQRRGDDLSAARIRRAGGARHEVALE